MRVHKQTFIWSLDERGTLTSLRDHVTLADEHSIQCARAIDGHTQNCEESREAAGAEKEKDSEARDENE